MSHIRLSGTPLSFAAVGFKVYKRHKGRVLGPQSKRAQLTTG